MALDSSPLLGDEDISEYRGVSLRNCAWEQDGVHVGERIHARSSIFGPRGGKCGFTSVAAACRAIDKLLEPTQYAILVL